MKIYIYTRRNGLIKSQLRQLYNLCVIIILLKNKKKIGKKIMIFKGEIKKTHINMCVYFKVPKNVVGINEC